MAEYTHLPKAPITEALIDIRVKQKDGLAIDVLDNIDQFVTDQYPNKKKRKQFRTLLKKEKGKSPRLGESSEIINGYLYTSEDGKQVFQARVDGFTFNRLKPYQDWDHLRGEAFRLWEIYANTTTPEITRVALRYINKIEIPIPFKDFNDYLVGAPIVPEGLPQAISSFLTRVVIPEPNLNAVGIITQSFEQIVDPKFVPILLDIDVFQQSPDNISTDDAWSIIDKLRDFKNNLFFKSITEELKEQFL